MTTTRQPEWMERLAALPDRRSAACALGPALLNATDEERALVAKEWSAAAEWPYPSPARLACTVGEDFSPRDRIVSSLVIDSLEGLVGTREHLIALSATYRSCELAGLAPGEVFTAVAAVLPPGHAEALRAFLRRSPEDRALSAFGLVERLNSDGEVEVHPL